MFKIFIICVLILSKLTAEQLLVNSGIKDFTQTPHINGSNTITLNTIPVRSAGGGCDASIDTIAVTSDRSSQLICQSGSWHSASAGGGTGIKGIFTPLAGKSISCIYAAATFYSQVDSTGIPYVRVTSGVKDSGWVQSFTTSVTNVMLYTVTLSTNGINGAASGGGSCTAYWPLN